MWHNMNKQSFAALLLFAWLLCVGCAESGPANYKLSGTITYKGSPVSKGEVFLRPVGGGPGGFGFIKDGKYETIDGKGSQGGASKITFHGFQNPSDSGNSGDLFPPYTIEVALPKEDHVFDIEIPSK